MRRWAVALSAVTLASAASTVFVAPAIAGERADPHVVSAGRSGYVPAKGYASHGARPNKSPNLLWHNGNIKQTAHVTAIYWGNKWANSSFVGDKQTGLASFYGGLKGSSYFATNDEYTGTNGQVNGDVSYVTQKVDTSAAPSKAPQTSQILGEVAKLYPNPDPDGYYAVYVDTPRGSARYCAWHSFGTINGTEVTFAFFFNLDGDPGCDPVAGGIGGHSQGLSALANVSGHELSETVTDPDNGGWWDSSGAENADKCAWTFNGAEHIGSSDWLIQGNWSNAAYNAGGTGYDGAGCINGN